MRIPRSREISKAITLTAREVKQAQKEMNQQAARLMEKGNYAGAQQAMQRAQQIDAFLGEVHALRQSLGELRGGGGARPPKGETHALWEYYQPILKTMIDLGGKAIKKEIEAQFKSTNGDWIKAGDMTPMARGKQRWQVMIQRAKKQLVSEGWIDTPNNRIWSITASGRQMAKKRIPAGSGTSHREG